uniref:Glycosyltransferase n=1 Tax=Fagopyrum tataricum TaxID=62330 RepID=A0A385L2G6_FAGTA|nr:UFGT9 [Fagopyrum tataricum]
MNPNLSINLSLLPSPSDPDLPTGSESLDSLPSLELRTRFLVACNSLLQPTRSILKNINLKPSFLISSFHWTSDLASEFGIPRFNFGTVSCFTLFVTHQMQAHNLIGNGKPDSDPFVIPGLPHRIEFTNAQLPLMLRKSVGNAGKNARNQSVRSLDSCDGILMNTFEDLEFDYCKLYQGIKENVFCIGPLSSISPVDENHACLKWLDSVKEPNSVIYICFGSMARVSSRQLNEIGLGLKRSNQKFIWVVREGDFEDGELDFVEDGLNGRGLVVRKWAPQVAILSHVAVGGFVTHCGWNSVMEGVCAGVPMVTWPLFAEQFYNEKLVVDVLQVGVRVGVEVSTEGVDGDEAFVRKEEVERAVNELMGGGEKGEERRRRAKELGEAARKAVEVGGSSESNLTLFIEHVKKKLSDK